DRRVLLAASTREGEEELLLGAADRLPADGTLTVIVPRHPQRFDAVAQLLSSRALAFARRSTRAPGPPDCRYVPGDSIGEGAAYCRACDVAFIGGSLLEYGGQNLIEACAAGVPVLIGPHTFNFTQAADSAVAAGAALRVDRADDVLLQARKLFADADLRVRMG